MKYILALLSIILSFLSVSYARAQKIVLITDVDDTIKISAVMAGTTKFAENAAQANAFFAMPELFRNFVSNNVNSKREVFYVTGAKGPLAYPANHFIQVNQFPAENPIASQALSSKISLSGSLSQISSFISKLPGSSLFQQGQNDKIDPYFPIGTGSSYLNDKINQMILNGKVDAIKTIMDSDPEIIAILLGDNGQLDPDVYHKISALYPNRTYTFIHYIYAGPVKTQVNYSALDTRKRFEIYNQQIPFFTTAELALHFYNLGFVTREEFLTIIDQSLLALEPALSAGALSQSQLAKNQKAFYANWMTGCLGFMQSEWEKTVAAQIQLDNEANIKLMQLKNVITSYPGCEIVK